MNGIRVVNPDGGHEVTVSPKAYEQVYRPRGFMLVDPESYTPPPPPVVPPALNDHMADDIIGLKDASPLEPPQTAKPRGRK